MSLIVPMLLAYNFISNIVGKVTRYTEDWASFFMDSFSGLTNDWYILDKGPVPVVPATMYRKSNMSNVGWIYNSSYNVLAAVHSEESPVRLPFLSACLISNETVYELDEFLEEFRVIHANHGRFLTPREIVVCWQIYSRVWLDTATLNVIDREGNEYSVDAFGEGNQEWKDLLYVVDEDVDADDEASEEEEEAEEAEEAKETEAKEEEETEAEEEAEAQEEEQEQEQVPVLDQSVATKEEKAHLVATIDLPHLAEDGFSMVANA